jgi:AbrB family looped-hinge helix DNA binding protein
VKEYAVTLSSKGQLTLPADVRRDLRLGAGDRLRLVVRDDGGLELGKLPYRTIDDVAGAAGSLREPRSWHELRDLAREERVDAFDGKTRRT